MPMIGTDVMIRSELRNLNLTSTSAETENPVTSKQPRSARRVLALLEQVAQAPDGMSLAELSVATEVPKSTLLTMLTPLVCDGYLVQSRGRYRLDRAAFRLANRILRHRHLNLIVRPYMQELMAASRETVSFAVLDPETRQARYVEVIESDQPVRFVMPVGGHRPLYASASGRVLLAYQPARWIDDYLKTTIFEKLASKTVTGPAEIRRILEDIRRKGFAVTDGTVVEEGGAISCPVLDHRNAVIGALAIAAPRDRANRHLTEWIRVLQDVATRVSAALA